MLKRVFFHKTVFCIYWSKPMDDAVVIIQRTCIAVFNFATIFKIERPTLLLLQDSFTTATIVFIHVSKTTKYYTWTVSFIYLMRSSFVSMNTAARNASMRQPWSILFLLNLEEHGFEVIFDILNVFGLAVSLLFNVHLMEYKN